MTRTQRLLAAIHRQPVDRVPFATYNLHPYLNPPHVRDESYRELLMLVEEKAGMVCKCGLTAITPGSEERLETTVETFSERAVHTTLLHTPKGDLRSITVVPKNQPAMVTEHFLKTDEDIERYMSLPYEPPQFDATPVRQMCEALHGRGLAYVGYSDPMYEAAGQFNFEDFAMRCLTDMPRIRRLVDHLFARVMENTRRQAQACKDLDVLFYTAGPEVATPPMLPPRMFAELVTPYQTKLIEVIHATGHPVAIHCHGRVRHVLEEIIKTGADVLEPIEPPDQGDITLAELLEVVKGRICLMGYIQDQEFHSVTPGAMTRRVQEIASLVNSNPAGFAGKTGYIMTPTCTPFQFPATATFLRNYEEWIQAADRYLR